jgi:hypothetical protein
LRTIGIFAAHSRISIFHPSAGNQKTPTVSKQRQQHSHH